MMIIIFHLDGIVFKWILKALLQISVTDREYVYIKLALTYAPILGAEGRN